ncbi:MAG TPA: DISARM system helicase DrmA [Blastocatellia bacterium]|nr:DISARM system helicase DrmA [Blastocatellia bacterium]
MEPIAKSESIRQELVQALALDLVGPSNDHAFARELLSQSPSRWYLTGFLVPSEAPVEQKTDETATEEIDSGPDVEGTDDATIPERATARRSILPSSMGLSVLVGSGVETLRAEVSWGDYAYEGPESDEPSSDSTESDARTGSRQATSIENDGSAESVQTGSSAEPPSGWRRIPRSESVTISLDKPRLRPIDFLVPNGGGLTLAVTIRQVAESALTSGRIPAGTRSVSVFLVNNRRPDPDNEHSYRAFIFQVGVKLSCEAGFTARPDLRVAADGSESSDWDEMVADLQYRDTFEYAVGHGVSATAEIEQGGSCHAVRTTWIPTAQVERVAPASISDVELGMEALGTLADGQEAVSKLAPLVKHYREWMAAQGVATQRLSGQRASTSAQLMIHAEHAAKRIELGISLLADPDVLEAFRIANRAMGRAARQREAIQRQIDPAAVPPPAWRPFQLAFILMTLQGLVGPLHSDRETVDLLFFPTGGGKTEAYLGLAAFTMVLRRFRNPGIRSSGISVLMRYTLRLLTLDQLGRAAALMCALELEREQTTRLGDWPFEIGLWVGSAATPNRMGQRGDTGPGKEYTAYRKTVDFLADDRKPAPIPIESCPWCGKKFKPSSFRLVPSADRPENLRVKCADYKCPFSGDESLPIVGVDEQLYRRLPAFVIATIDKFAALPWTGQTGSLFGLVDRYDNKGFYGPFEPGLGKPISSHLPPPDLIIQDELHLISGPLGTIAGLYETAIDALCARKQDGKTIRPKIIASTATVRRADAQIRALFERTEVNIFPPPGPDRRNSFFAVTQSPEESPARLYVGVAAQGRSLKVVLLRAALALLSAAQTAYNREGGKRNKQNPADPYMTLLGYFNSLRELGGSRRIVEDEVRTRLEKYSRRVRIEPPDALFADRAISYDVVELTSRVSTSMVAEAKERLTRQFQESDHVDVALATNMISVGLDIVRLGLMVVLGQPKTSAEYIQATSRVGRDPQRPGLIVTLSNVHKPRDRSHYERFETYHSSFYRAVEATSVTPFAPRALDRALAAALVGLCRQDDAEMTPALGAGAILSQRTALTPLALRFAERAGNNTAGADPEQAERLRQNVLARCTSLLDDWLKIADQYQRTNTKLQYQREIGAAQRLLRDFLDPELQVLPEIHRRFRAGRSMRDVEPSVELDVKNMNEWSQIK